MCTRDLVARGKPTAHPREQRAAVPGLACVGSVGWVPLGVVPTPFAGAYERSLNSRSSLPRATGAHARLQWCDDVHTPWNPHLYVHA
ncbi:hypothetical protein ACFIOZ_07405 [Vreelandella sp. F11]|uniref:hypothetical protein n=1 Tax=Vreelandella sp. F11 TaxID=3394751 RepID=UPI0036DC4F76